MTTTPITGACGCTSDRTCRFLRGHALPACRRVRAIPADHGRVEGPAEYLSYNESNQGSHRMEQRLKAARDVVGLRGLAKVAASVGATSVERHLLELSRIYTWPSDHGRVEGPANIILVPPAAPEYPRWGSPDILGGESLMPQDVPTVQPTPEAAAMYAEWFQRDLDAGKYA